MTYPRRCNCDECGSVDMILQELDYVSVNAAYGERMCMQILE